MQRSGSELLFFGLIIAGFMLFNYLAPRLAKKARELQAAADAEAAAEAATLPPEEAPMEDIWGRTLVAAPAAPKAVARATPEPQAAPLPPTRLRLGARLFHTKKDLRHAIVLMTVLGPCRALEPHEERR